MKNKINAIIGLCVFVFITLACNASFTTANIGSFAFGKNDTANPPVTSFNVGEQVFAVVNVANAMGKHKVKFKIARAGGAPVEQEIAFEGSRSVHYSFTPSVPGEIKFDVSLLDEGGKEIDKKSGSITVKGDAAPTTSTDKPKTDDAGQDDEKPESK